MFKKFLFVLVVVSSAVFLSACSLKKTPAALQINTTPAANVFVDGKLLGKTPYQGSNWNPGEISLKLIPESTTLPLVSWEGKIKLDSGVLTLIERDFAVSENESSGEILTLEKIKDKKLATLSVISDPDGTLISVDGEAKGFAPLSLDKIGVGDHQITITKEGYEEKTVRAKTIAGFKLIVNVKLAQKPETPTASVSGGLTPIPTVKASSPKTTTSPTPKPSGTATEATQVLIKETPTGWLRVRLGPSKNATDSGAKINPGEEYPLLGEESGWYKIEYEEGKEGWVSGQYATKI